MGGTSSLSRARRGSSGGEEWNGSRGNSAQSHPNPCESLGQGGTGESSLRTYLSNSCCRGGRAAGARASKKTNGSLGMKLIFFGLSLSSSWGNGHATTYRALLRAL